MYLPIETRSIFHCITSSEEGFIDEKHLQATMSVLRIIFLVTCMCMLYTIVHSETLSKICCQGNPNYNLAERNGDVVLALANDSDPYQVNFCFNCINIFEFIFHIVVHEANVCSNG